MRILIDLQGAQTESRFRGIGRYSLALVLAIIRNAGQHEIWILLNGDMRESCQELQTLLVTLIPEDRVVVFYAPVGVSLTSNPSAWLRSAAELMREHFIVALAPDIVYVTSLFEGACEANAVLSIGLLETFFLTVSTLYDLIPLLNAETYLATPTIKVWYMEKIESLKRADLLLSISEYAREEAIEALGLAATDVVNISSAHTDFFRPIKVDEVGKRALFKRLGITQPYVMFNSAFEYRKNVDRLIAAYGQLDASLRAKYQLVLTGKISEAERYRLHHYAKSLGIEHEVLLTGYLEDDDLLILFNSTDLFVFPSVHEGFGLPALEAMACGVATIGSNNTSIPEVIDLPEALFDPFDVDSIKNKITEVLTNQDLRQRLIRHGLAQSKKFSWDLSANRAIKAFEEIYHKKRSAPTFVPRPQGSMKYYQAQIEVLAAIPSSVGAPSDLDLKRVAKSLVRNQMQLNRLLRDRVLPESICWRVEGPFDSSYSIALLNRETASALAALGHTVSLHSTEGPGDFLPSPEFLKANPQIAKLYDASKAQLSLDADVSSRNLYPPRVSDMDSSMNLLHHYAWEESGFPQDWVDEFNRHLQGMTCLSHHVQKILVDNGVKVPMVVSGCGVDHWDRIVTDSRYQISAKPFRFLHVSSCFPRKGADVLLDAYGKAFTSEDPVTLVIKTFINPHNQIHDWLAVIKKKYPKYPDVLIIEIDLSDAQLKSLYEQCDAMVAPSRAEGFGLPMAEAMLSGLAVITTAWGGQLDFCNEKTAWLIDYEFKRSDTHFGLFDSVWAEPNVHDLSQTMADLYQLSPSLRGQKVKAGQALLREHFQWTDVARRLVDAVRTWQIMPKLQPTRIAWVSTWNTRCGIATYSEHLIDAMPDDVTIFAAHTEHQNGADRQNVRRCWQAGLQDPLHALSEAIDEDGSDCVVIQFNYSLFNIDALECLLLRQLNQGRVVVVMMHSTLDPIHVMPEQRLDKIRATLARCDRILVHSPADLNRLKSLGLIHQVSLFPHGVLDLYKGRFVAEPYGNQRRMTLTIASYGFFLPHKGLLELIEVFDRLLKMGYPIHLSMVNAAYPVPESAELIAQARLMIATRGLVDSITLVTDYLMEELSVDLLRDADLLVYPYQETGESSSAAVRYGLALGKTVLVTPLPIFDDVAEVVYQMPGVSVEAMVDGLKAMLDAMYANDPDLAVRQARLSAWREQHLYERVGQKLSGMLHSLLN